MSAILRYVIGIPSDLEISGAVEFSQFETRYKLGQPEAVDWRYVGSLTREDWAKLTELYSYDSPLMKRMIPWMEWDKQKLTEAEVQGFLEGSPELFRELIRPYLLRVPVPGYYQVTEELTKGQLVPISYRYRYGGYRGWDFSEDQKVLVFANGKLEGGLATGRWTSDVGPGASDAMIFDFEVSFQGQKFIRHYSNTYDMPQELLPVIGDSILRDLVLLEPELVIRRTRYGYQPRIDRAELDKWQKLERLT